MHSKNMISKNNFRLKIILFLSVMVCYIFNPSRSCSEVVDRVVAYVDNTAVTLSEFHENYKLMKEKLGNVTETEVINSIINQILLLKEAREMRLEAPTTEELLKDYVEIRIKASILIKEEDIEKFYAEHAEEFKGKEYASARDEIEKYLYEMETNKRLKKNIEAVRSRAEIKIQLKD